MALISNTVLTAATTATGTYPASGGVANQGWSPGQYDASVALQVTTSVTSGSPSAVFKLQGSVDGGVTFVDLAMLPSDSDTVATSFTKATVNTWVYFVAQSPGYRKFTHYQLVVSTLTTITIAANLCLLT